MIKATDCLICSKHKESKRITFQNELLAVSHRMPKSEQEQVYLGYYFIEPKRHFKGFYDASDEEITAIALALRNLGKALKQITTVEHVYSFMIGEGVDHFHIHVLARYKDTPKEYYGASVDEWPEAPKGNLAAVESLDRSIRESLKLLYTSD